MKIEKINDNQIRCTLTRDDLASRQIRISELAYGSDKAKELFRDLMQQALQECGFEAGNMPLMIEAVPLSPDSMVLIITKVDDPEELDSRFSRFSPEDSQKSASGSQAVSSASISGADDVLDLISRLRKTAKPEEAKPAKEAAQQQTPPADTTPVSETDPEDVYRLTRFYLFHDIETVIRAGRVASDGYTGPSSLYKNPEDGNYFLLLKKGETPADQFNRICNTISEYGLQADYLSGMEEYFGEHLQVIIPKNALHTLSQL